MQVGGGLIVISSGWVMLNQKDANQSRLAQANRHLCRCFESGVLPAHASFDGWSGSISVAITLGANAPQHLGANLLVILRRQSVPLSSH